MTTNRPLIAVTPLMDYGRDSLWMLPGYMEAIMRAGGTPVMLPLTDDTDILAQCAGCGTDGWCSGLRHRP